MSFINRTDRSTSSNADFSKEDRPQSRRPSARAPVTELRSRPSQSTGSASSSQTNSIDLKISFQNALDRFRSSGEKVDGCRNLYNMAISKMKLSEAMEGFSQMKAAGIIPNTKNYTTLMTKMAQTEDVKTVAEVFKEMKKNNVERDFITYVILISALQVASEKIQSQKDKKFYKEKIAEFMASAVEDKAFKSGLGFYKEKNKLDFHAKWVYTGSRDEGAVSKNVAVALFDYHLQQGTIDSATKFVVGRAGDDIIKNAIIEHGKRVGWRVFPATYNAGLLISDRKNKASVSSAEASSS